MKKIMLFLLSIIIIFSNLSFAVYAEVDQTVVSETTVYFEDGSYMVTSLVVEDTLITRATSTTSGSKKVIIYNANDEKLVELKLSATFSYTGSSATCTNVAPTFTVYNSNWRVTKSTGTKSGNKGIGEFIAKKYTLGINTQTIEETITITCSNTGTLS